METFATKNITTSDKYKKNKELNSFSSTEHKTDMNITKIKKIQKKTEQQFCRGTQNRHEHY